MNCCQNNKLKKIGIIIPWYGVDARGGAETEANMLAHAFIGCGYEIEVLTTCVKSAAEDRGLNQLKSGVKDENGVTVRRFLVDKRNVALFQESNTRIYNGKKISRADELDYCQNDINSIEMYEYIFKHKTEYETFIIMPYLYGVCINSAKYCAGNYYVMPCMHDENYAHMMSVKSFLRDARGVFCLSYPEKELICKLHDVSKERIHVTGAIVDNSWDSRIDENSFRKKYQIEGRYILYAGRKDEGKKAYQLKDFFIRFMRNSGIKDLQLVYIGGGDLEIPEEYRGAILDLGFVSSEDKYNAMAGAMVLCNPSYYESFSIVIMESWLAKRPVLVSTHCEVTKDFVKRTNGGLYFDNYPEFEECLNYFMNNVEVANEMALSGREFVKRHFAPEIVVNKIVKTIVENR